MSVNQAVLISGPHTHAGNSVSEIMGNVIIALLPVTLFAIYLFGLPTLYLIIISILTALLAEYGCLWLMDKPARPFLTDGSAALTGLLVALAMPPWAPWWIAVVGSGFAIVIGKQLFGGLGQNVFNPAMLARVMLLIAFPLEMTTWIAPHPLLFTNSPGFLESLSITFIGISDIDAISSASLLGHIKTELTLGHSIPEILQQQENFSLLNSFVGFTNGSLGESSGLLLTIGGLYLLFRRIITWHIPVAMILTTVALASGFNYYNPDRYLDAAFHLLNGGAILAIFFIATDPVTSPSTALGKIIFGVGCSTIEYVIRTWGAFPEGIGFAILLMNALTPLIDHYIRPRIYGRNRAGKPLEQGEIR